MAEWSELLTWGITCPTLLCVQIQPETFDFFMWGIYQANLLNNVGSTQTPACVQNNAQRGTWSFYIPVEAGKPSYDVRPKPQQWMAFYHPRIEITVTVL